MYAGHIGIALGARRARDDVPLWLLVLAAQGCDWADVVFGDFDHLPHAELWSHSLLAVAIGALLTGLLALAIARTRGAALLVAAVYLSHIAADYVTGHKPTWAGGPRIGLALYGHAVADFALECAIVVGGWLLYRGSLPRGARRGTLLSLLLAALLGAQLLVDISFGLKKWDAGALLRMAVGAWEEPARTVGAAPRPAPRGWIASGHGPAGSRPAARAGE